MKIDLKPEQEQSVRAQIEQEKYGTVEQLIADDKSQFLAQDCAEEM